MSKTGKCLCGEVKVEVTAKHTEVGMCHCEMCRRWTSGPMMVMHVGKDIKIEGEENITAYRSSEWGERSFCNKCGTSLYYKMVQSGEYMLSVGLLDQQDGLSLTNQIFVDEKPEFYDIANDTPKMTGAQVFAMYAPKDE